MKLHSKALVLLNGSVVMAQSFANATAAYSQLSEFTRLLLSNSIVAQGLIINVTAESTADHPGSEQRCLLYLLKCDWE